MKRENVNRVRKRKKKRKILVMVCTVTALIGVSYIGIKKVRESNNIKESASNNIVTNDNTDLVKEESQLLDQPVKETNGDIQENCNYSDNGKIIEKRLKEWNFTSEENSKVAYLTFDDGPSDYVTEKVLDILAENDVKATFFVLGTSIEANDKTRKLLRRIVKEGHSIGNHGYCHDYKKLYPNGQADPDFFMEDIRKTEKVINETLGYEYNSKIIRFPGGHGSWKTKQLDERLAVEGYSYIDWNTLTGDAESSFKTTEQLKAGLSKTVADLEGNNDIIVVLMHDTDMKKTTAQSLDENIKYLKSLGYEFRVLR